MTDFSDKYFSDFEEFKKEFSDDLLSKDLVVLDDFLQNKNNIKRYYEKYVSKNKPKIVLCGINPGRFGAGLTGIPFIDFKSLSKMLNDINRTETEQSAQFFFRVIEKIGKERFYQNCYVTNISKFGFAEQGKSRNVNYYDLPKNTQRWLLDRFCEEMNFINPNIIIPLSQNVEHSLNLLKDEGKLSFNIGERINHPSWVMTYRKNDEDIWIKKYCDEILKHF